MSRRTRQSAYLVPRRAIIGYSAVLFVVLAAALWAVVALHGSLLPQDLLLVELSAALLVVAMVVLASLPVRIRRVNRRLERTMASLRSNEIDAGVQSLGPLGTVFQEHFRLLWRSTQLQKGTMAVQEALIQNLLTLEQKRVIVCDGRGRVRYRSASLENLEDQESSAVLPTEPPVHRLVGWLLAGESCPSVKIQGNQYYCYGIFGAVLLQRATGGDAPLQPRNGLAFLLFTQDELPELRGRLSAGTAPISRRGIGSRLQRIFGGAPGRRD